MMRKQISVGIQPNGPEPKSYTSRLTHQHSSARVSHETKYAICLEGTYYVTSCTAQLQTAVMSGYFRKYGESFRCRRVCLAYKT